MTSIIAHAPAARSVPRSVGPLVIVSSDPDVVRALNRFVALGALFAFLAGLLGFAGWVFDVAVFKSLIPGQVMIKPNAAIALALCGGALWLLRNREDRAPRRSERRAGEALAWIVMLIGLASLSEHVAGWNLGIDQLLFTDPDPWEAFGRVRPGLMAPMTALNFVLIGLALLWLDRAIAYRSRRYSPTQLLAFAANTIAIIGLLDFIFDSHTSYTHIALPAALGLFVLSIAVACARTDWGLGALIASPGYGGLVTRWLWSAALGVPLLVGVISWAAYTAGLVSDWSRATVMIVAMSSLLSVIVYLSGRSIDRSDAERRLVEEALRETEANLNKAQAIAHLGSWYLDVRRNRLWWSDEVFRIFGLPQGAPLTYESFLETIPPVDRKAVDEAWRAAMQGAPYDIEHRILVGGAVKWVREQAQVEFEGVRAVHGIGTVHDITERKHAEEEVRRVNRALRALSLCNEALVRATDEPALLHEICRIIAEEAGYRFCWVGRAQQDEAKRVTPVAHAGLDEGYVEAAGITWSDADADPSPAGRAISSGTIQIVTDTAAGPMATRWRAAATTRGCASIIAIPLVVEGRRFGALSIHAAEMGAFRTEEVALLTELASDLAFGIETLRTKAERERAERDIRALNAELEERVRVRTADLEAARDREAKIGFRIQQMLLVTQPPTDIPGVQVAALTIPSERIDGDFYDFFTHEGRRLDVIVADVMGKGIRAALLAGATKSNFLEALCHLLALSKDGRLPEPKEIVTLAHADMVRQLIDLESFVTLIYARVDLNRNVLDLVDCGHTGMIVARAGSGLCETLHGDNLPLGVCEGEVFDQIAVPFEAGDLFLFYSDGVTDVRNADGELFGADRLSACVQRNRDLEPAALVDAIRQAVTAFAPCDPPADDLTCVAVKVVETPRPRARSELEIGSQLADLGRARAFVREFCRTLPGGPSGDDLARLELAVNEAASNIMKHAYHGRVDQRIQLEAAMFPGRVSIRLYHVGEPFDAKAVSLPALDGSRESGFGTYLIANCVDEIRYSRDERGRNCIALTKVIETH